MAKLAVCAAVLLVLLVAWSETSPMKFCCTQYQQTQVPVKVLKSYRIQDDTGYCNIKAAVLKTKKNKELCANPEEEWVQKAMESLPRRH